jgi:hypothetical protein
MTPEERKEYDALLRRCEPQIVKLAQDAVKNDGWIVPTTDKINKSYDEYELAEIEGWSETDAFNIRWRSRINELVIRELDECKVLTVDDGEIRIELAGELVDTFWEEWAAGHKLYEFWKKHQKKGRKHGKKA